MDLIFDRVKKKSQKNILCLKVYLILWKNNCVVNFLKNLIKAVILVHLEQQLKS